MIGSFPEQTNSEIDSCRLSNQGTVTGVIGERVGFRALHATDEINTFSVVV